MVVGYTILMWMVISCSMTLASICGLAVMVYKRGLHTRFSYHTNCCKCLERSTLAGRAVSNRVNRKRIYTDVDENDFDDIKRLRLIGDYRNLPRLSQYTSLYIRKQHTQNV